jgi:hypothetical protein
MPTKLVVLVSLLAFSIVLDVVLIGLGANGWKAWFRPFLTAVLLIEVMRGRERARVLLQGLAVLGLVVSLVVVVWLIDVLPMVRELGLVTGLFVAGIFAIGVAAAASLFTIWCLGRPDVKAWMSGRSAASGRSRSFGTGWPTE